MLYEYGVDPGCFKGWDRFIYLIEQFGIPHGRLISQFPKSWIKMVLDGCKHFTFRQRKMMEDELKRIRDQALVRSGRHYDGAKSWIQNAIEQHETKKFHAIITEENTAGMNFVLVASEITRTTHLWDVPHEDAIARTAGALASAIAPLLQMSTRILFIDKFFEPATSKWQETLLRFIELSLDGGAKSPSIEYHLKIEADELMKDGKIRKDEFQEYCDRCLAEVIPAGIEMKLFRWLDKAGGEDMHARYILTERGGIRVDWGLDKGSKGQTTDVSLLDARLWKKRWDSYQESSNVFELIDSICITGRCRIDIKSSRS